MSTEIIEAPAKPSLMSRLMRLIGFLGLAAVLAGAGFGAGWFYFANPLSPAQDMLRLITPPAEGAEHAADSHAEGEDAPHKVAKPVPEKPKFVTSYYTFADPLTTNIANSRKFLQVQIGVSTQYDASVIENVKAHEMALKSDILAVTATFGEDQLATVEGRGKLADAIRDAMNKRLEELEGFGGVEHVFFPSFMMQ